MTRYLRNLDDISSNIPDIVHILLEVAVPAPTFLICR